MYSLSRDYAKLFQLLLAGHEAAGFVTTKDYDNGDVVSVKRLKPWTILIGSRGISHACIYPFNEEDGFSEEVAFIKAAEFAGLQWIDPTPPASQESAIPPGMYQDTEGKVPARIGDPVGLYVQADPFARQESAGEAQVAHLAERCATLTAKLAAMTEQRDSLRDECERLREALTPKPPREGIYPWAVALEPTARNAQFWIEGARKEERKGHAILCAEQAVNAWKNAAYHYAEKLAALSASGREGE